MNEEDKKTTKLNPITEIIHTILFAPILMPLIYLAEKDFAPAKWALSIMPVLTVVVMFSIIFAPIFREIYNDGQ